MTRNAQYKQKVTLSSWRQIHKKPAQEKQWMQSYAATFPCDCTSPRHLLLANSRHSVLPRSLPLLFSAKKKETKCGFNLWKQLIISRWRIHWLIFPSCLIKYFQKKTDSQHMVTGKLLVSFYLGRRESCSKTTLLYFSWVSVLSRMLFRTEHRPFKGKEKSQSSCDL